MKAADEHVVKDFRPNPLHITTSAKIIAKHRRITKPSISVVKDEVQSLAKSAPLDLDKLIVADLQS